MSSAFAEVVVCSAVCPPVRPKGKNGHWAYTTHQQQQQQRREMTGTRKERPPRLSRAGFERACRSKHCRTRARVCLGIGEANIDSSPFSVSTTAARRNERHENACCSRHRPQPLQRGPFNPRRTRIPKRARLRCPPLAGYLPTLSSALSLGCIVFRNAAGIPFDFCLLHDGRSPSFSLSHFLVFRSRYVYRQLSLPLLLPLLFSRSCSHLFCSAYMCR